MNWSETERLFERYYKANPAFTDGTTRFHRQIRNSIPADAVVLEIGGGPSNETSAYLASISKRLMGIDVSSEVLSNTALSEAFVIDGKELPFPADSFDACASNYVLEHIEDPAAHFAEVARTLKPGGVYCFRTPNLLHYIPFAARLLPYAAHLRWSNWLQATAADAHDPYPTYYRANTRARIRQLCDQAGLKIRELLMVESDPSYGRRHALLFFPMMAYERVVNSSEFFSRFRVNILGVVEKTKRRYL